MALRSSVFDRKGIMPEPEKELHAVNDGSRGPLSLTDDQARIFQLHNFQRKRLGLLQTLGEKLHLRRSQLESTNQPVVGSAQTEASGPITSTIEGPGGQGRS